MKIAYTSDVHRGFSNNTARVQEKHLTKFLQTHTPDVLLLVGDIASHKMAHQWRGAFNLYRRHLPNTPILAVRGNHDFWVTKKMPHLSLDAQNVLWQRACEASGIINLEGNIHQVGAVTFGGWLSWWQPPTGGPDQHWMSKQVMSVEMGRLEYESYASMHHRMPRPVDNLILVTHMAPDGHAYNSSPYFLPQDLGAMALICGHSHRVRDEVLLGVRILNAGPDYDKPSIQILDTETGLISGDAGNVHRHY